MNGIGRLVRRGFEARRHFVSLSSSSSSSSPMMSLLSRSGLASLTKPTSSISYSPFGKCGFLEGQKRGLKSLCKFKGKSAGRNSQGRITIFHRGGGAKRLQRRIDLKRSTVSMGVVERVEYDPNQSARIALVRWTAEMQTPRKKKADMTEKYTPLSKTVDPTASDLRGVFSFSTLPGMRRFDEQTKTTQAKDVFLSTFSSNKGSADITPLPLPRIAIAGANPAFLASRMIEKLGGKDASTLCEVQKCRLSNSVIWAHKMKRKAAISWHSSKQKLALGNFTRQKTVAAKKTAF